MSQVLFHDSLFQLAIDGYDAVNAIPADVVVKGVGNGSDRYHGASAYGLRWNIEADDLAILAHSCAV